MHAAAYMGMFLFIAEKYSTVWTYRTVCPSRVDGHLGCFQLGALMNKAAVDTWGQVLYRRMSSFSVFDPPFPPVQPRLGRSYPREGHSTGPWAA